MCPFCDLNGGKTTEGGGADRAVVEAVAAAIERTAKRDEWNGLPFEQARSLAGNYAGVLAHACNTFRRETGPAKEREEVERLRDEVDLLRARDEMFQEQLKAKDSALEAARKPTGDPVIDAAIRFLRKSKADELKPTEAALRLEVNRPDDGCRAAMPVRVVDYSGQPGRWLVIPDPKSGVAILRLPAEAVEDAPALKTA